VVILTIDTVGDQKIIRGFNRYTAMMKDFRPVFNEVAEFFYRTEEKIFASEGNPEMFVPLSPIYKAWKSKHYPGRKIMELTGRLRRSLTGKGQADAQDTVRIIKKTFAEFGSQAPYVHRHQMGTFGMPQRKIIQFTETRKRTITNMIHQWSFEKLQASLGLHQRMLK
jgi:phage gpG-like protein